MVDLVRWEPFREMANLRDAVDRWFEESAPHPSWFRGDGGRGDLAMDMYQTDDNLVVKASLPGYKSDEVDISIVGDTLTIKGEHKEEEEVKEEDYFYKERHYGRFSRSLLIPIQVKSDKAEATFENGVLTLTLPKTEEIKPKQIKIKAKSVIGGGK